MNAEAIVICSQLLAALAAGGLVGLERTYHGRAAGFRTHALVSIASSSLMLVTVHQEQWFPASAAARVTIDPTRMAQGIMTGIGFLGAGVIFKEGLSVRGLTTAASIWVTAAIGILAGIGFYFPLIVTTVLTVATLSIFRWLEAQMPQQTYAELDVSCSADGVIAEAELRRLIAERGFAIVNLKYHYNAESRSSEYTAVIWTKRPENVGRLAESLRAEPAVRGFSLAPIGD